MNFLKKCFNRTVVMLIAIVLEVLFIIPVIAIPAIIIFTVVAICLPILIMSIVKIVKYNNRHRKVKQ